MDCRSFSAFYQRALLLIVLDIILMRLIETQKQLTVLMMASLKCFGSVLLGNIKLLLNEIFFQLLKRSPIRHPLLHLLNSRR